MFISFWNRLRRRHAVLRRPRTFRPALELLEGRTVPSAGLLSATSNAQNQAVTFAIRADQTLWEYDPGFATPDHWMQVSPGAFVSISASPYVTPDGPVVFGIVAGDHSLWEHDAAFNPGAASLNEQWVQVSPAAFDSVSATVGTVGGQLEPVVYGVVSEDHSLWVNAKPPAFDSSSQSLNDYWRQVSPGAFTSIAAAFHQDPTPTSSQPTPPIEPVVFGIIAGDHSIWENSPQFNTGASDLNAQWEQATTAAYTTIGAGDVSGKQQAFFMQEQLPVVYGIRQADGSLWEATFGEEVEISAAPWQTVSAPAPISISAVDESLWSTGHTNGSNYTVEISAGTFRAVAADGGVVFAEPTDHSVWEYDPTDFNPQSTDPAAHWALLSPAGVAD